MPTVPQRISVTTVSVRKREKERKTETNKRNKFEFLAIVFDYSRLGSRSAGTILFIMVRISGVIYDAQRHQHCTCVHGSAS